ncbi:MAG: type II toxin-antitoxin system YhaV family toxin, partial [Trueperaceae bacterium]|nr:type II toxin-antitoxin system YhaV family toxin [Trueperaceae bacterium]
TLGPEHRHWRRAVFLERYRLFFRFDADARVVVVAWVNDDRTLRSRGARNDPYAVFCRRLVAGDPPTSRDALLAAAHPARPMR